MSNVSGKRSPKWAVMERMNIPCEDGTEYLTRLRVIQTPWFGVYLHDLKGTDKESPHDHPWDFYSIILQGDYTEKVYPYPHVSMRLGNYQRTWRKFSIHKMHKEWAHRISHVEPGTKSLILVGKRSRNWGFYEAGTWVPWQEYEGV